LRKFISYGNCNDKKINWLFPDPDVEVTLEDYRDKIREDEKSGDMSVSEFKRRLEQWLVKSI